MPSVEVKTDYPKHDDEFRDLTVTATALFESGGWSIGTSDGWSFFVPADSPIEPRVDMSARFYGRGIGSIVRGLFLDGVQVFYRTKAEQQEQSKREAEERDRVRRFDYQQNRADFDRRVSALPAPLRERLVRFRRTSPDWSWQHEPYELATCEAAASIVEALRVEGASDVFYRGAFDMFREMSYASQVERVPALGEMGLSGNQFGVACRLAWLVLVEPVNAPREHAAICPLVGCRDAGCWAATSSDL